MNTQQMKVAALQMALTNDNQRGHSEAITFNKVWRIQCWCHQLTDFSFYLSGSRGIVNEEINWFPHREMTENEAQMFLCGMGETL